MTHTNHRRGQRQDLARDFVILTMPARGINDEGAKARLRKFLRIVAPHNPVNMGEGRQGTVHAVGLDALLEKMPDATACHAVFRDPATVAAVLKEIADAGLGLSVVVSGLFDVVDECCQKSGIRRHTVEFSLGTWGKTEKLPSEAHLEITTMCGHGMVPAGLVDDLARRVREGCLTLQEASIRMAKQCTCGVFDNERAAELLGAMVAV